VGILYPLVYAVVAAFSSPQLEGRNVTVTSPSSPSERRLLDAEARIFVVPSAPPERAAALARLIDAGVSAVAAPVGWAEVRLGLEGPPADVAALLAGRGPRFHGFAPTLAPGAADLVESYLAVADAELARSSERLLWEPTPKGMRALGRTLDARRGRLVAALGKSLHREVRQHVRVREQAAELARTPRALAPALRARYLVENLRWISSEDERGERLAVLTWPS
jgi:hypothetical protein